MAREIEIIERVWCDPCQAADQKTPAVREVTMAFRIPGRPLKEKLLGVCERHDVGVAQVEEWYRELAQEDPDRRKTTSTTRVTDSGRRGSVPNAGDPCIVCQALGVDDVPKPTTVEALRQHIAKFHSIGYTGYLRIAEGRYVVKGVNDDGELDIDFQGEKADITQCPHCPQKWDARLFDSPTRLLTSHVRREHKDMAQAS